MTSASQGPSIEGPGQLGGGQDKGSLQARVVVTSRTGTTETYPIYGESINIQFPGDFDPSDVIADLVSDKMDDKISEVLNTNADILEKTNKALQESKDLVNENCETLKNVTEIGKNIKKDIEENKGRPQWLDPIFMVAVISLIITAIAILMQMNSGLGGRIDSLVDSFNGRIDTLSGQINEIYQFLLQSKKF